MVSARASDLGSLACPASIRNSNLDAAPRDSRAAGFASTRFTCRNRSSSSHESKAAGRSGEVDSASDSAILARNASSEAVGRPVSEFAGRTAPQRMQINGLPEDEPASACEAMPGTSWRQFVHHIVRRRREGVDWRAPGVRNGLALRIGCERPKLESFFVGWGAAPPKNRRQGKTRNRETISNPSCSPRFRSPPPIAPL